MSTTLTEQDLRNLNEANSYLNRFRVKRGEDFTNTGMNNSYSNHNFNGSFFVPEEEYEEFLTNIGRFVFENNISLGITERHHPEFSPIVIDLDFRYDQEHGITRHHTKKNISKFIQLFHSELVKIVDLSKHAKNKFKYFVLERPQPRRDTKKNIIKDGVHIVCKDIQITYPILFLVRERVIRKMGSVFESPIFTEKIPFSEIFDKGVIRDCNWMLHGNTKKGVASYNVSGVYFFDKSGKFHRLMNYRDTFTNEYLMKTLSIRNGIIGGNITIREEAREDVIEYSKRIERRNKKVPNTFNMEEGNNIIRSNEGFVGEVYNDSQHNFVSQLVDCLNEQRATPFDTWLKVGWCLNNLSKTLAIPDKYLFSLWLKFSKKSPSYTDGIEWRDDWYNKYWNKTKETGPRLTIGSLRYWAKEDNPEAYARIGKVRIDRRIKDAIKNSSSHVTVARIVHEMYSDSFVCTDPSRSDGWYAFDKKRHRWVIDSNAHELYKRITHELANLVFDKMLQIQQRQRMEADENNEGVSSKKNEEELKPYRQLHLKIQDISYLEKLKKACAHEFCDREFINNLDTNNFLIGFNNGVYDLENGTFRDGHPEDFISKTVGYEFDPEITFNSVETQYVLRVLCQILPIEPVREYFLKVLASCLFGGNVDQSFWICQNSEGANGKTVLMEYMLNVLGSDDEGYANKLNVAILLQKRPDGQSASPELAKLKGKRFTYCEEPDQGSELNVGIMKELTGGGMITARFLNKNSMQFKNTTKFFMLCNDLPRISSDDQGTWRRVKNVRFPSRFVHRDNKVPYEVQYPPGSHHYPRDDSLPDELNQNYRMPMMALLIHYYNTFLKSNSNDAKKKVNSISVPHEVEEASRQYMRTQDILRAWIEQNLEIKEGSQLRARDIRDSFRQEYKDEAKNVKIKEIIDKIKKIFKRHFENEDVCERYNSFVNLGIKEHADNRGGGGYNFSADY